MQVCRSFTATSRRAAFTLIELLIVLSIIAVLVALTAGTVMQVLSGQNKVGTEREIRTVNDALTQHIRAVLDQANELPIPNSVMAIAGNDPKRAKVIWRKLQLKRNFPTTYNEAANPATYTGNTAIFYQTGDLIYQLSRERDMQPLTVFTKNFASLNASYTVGSNPQAEMGALLRLALSVNRRGTKAFIAEDTLGPTGVSDTNSDGLLEIVDAWGLPLAFFRFATDNADMIAANPNAGAPFPDPQDPEGTLLNSTWNTNNSAINPNFQQQVYLFELLCHRVHDPSQGNWVPQAVYTQPTIVSSGPNRRPGILMSASPSPYWPPGPPGSANFAMYADPADTNGYNDNIFSFTLR